MNDTKLAVLCYPPRSGITHYTYNLCRELAPHFKNLYLMVNRAADVRQDNTGYREIRLFSRTRWFWLDILKLIGFVFKENIQYLHFQSALKGWMLDLPVLLFFKAIGRKIIFTAHDVLPHTRKEHEKTFIRWIYQLMDMIIVHSAQNRDLVVAMGIQPGKIHVIPHGLYTMFLPTRRITMAEARKELGLKADDKVLLFFGSINPRKGAEKLVAGMDKLVAQDKTIKLVMAGTVDYRQGQMEELAAKKGIAEHVKIFGGWVPNDRVHYFFTAADMIVLPYNEGFTSGVLKLAYAFQKPVVTSGVGELAQVIAEEKTGIVIDEFFSETTAQQVAQILNSSPQLDAFRLNIGKIAQDKYSWEAIAEKTAKAYAGQFSEFA